MGLDKALLALVWIAGPLSGVLVQPYVGIKSDRCRSRFGKRRPFMVGGAIATMISVLVLAWAREIVGGIFGIFGAGPDSQVVKTTTMLFAVLFVYVLDFAINVCKLSDDRLNLSVSHNLQCKPPYERLLLTAHPHINKSLPMHGYLARLA